MRTQTTRTYFKVPEIHRKTFVKLLPSILAAGLSLMPSVQAQSFQNLLASHSLDQWMKVNGDPVNGGWTLEDGGVLHLSGKGGNIVTKEVFGDFELWFEFRVAAKGNNGLKYRVRQYEKQWLGLEYQILDDAAYPRLTREHLTGSLYELVTPIPAVTRLHTDDEFNVGKIRVQHQRAQHWINGQLLIDTPLCGPKWKAHVADSKFHDKAEFGENTTGHIMLTDHNSEVWYRNLFIRQLDNGCCR